MGNWVSAFPVTAQDVVLSYLNVLDAKRLMSTNKFLLTQVRLNHRFWVRRAKMLYDKDPAIFMRLRYPDIFTRRALVEHVCAADAVLQDTLANISSGRATEGVYELVNQVWCMALDEKACLLFVHIADARSEIFDIRRFGDPPIKVINDIRISDVVIHGSLIFYRSPRKPRRYHADVYNWRVSVPMASLEPRWEDVSRKLLKSDQFLVAYDARMHCARAYPLVVNGYEKDPVAVYFPQRTILHDVAVRGDAILAIYFNNSDGSFHFKSFNVGTNAILQQFAIESTLPFRHCRISYPYILLAFPPVVEMYRRHAYSIYGPRIRILGDDHRVFGDPRILAICSSSRKSSIVLRPDAGSDSQFIFIDDLVNERTIICHVGEPGSPFCQTDETESTDTAGRCWPLDCILSFGLSVVFARQHFLVFRRYARHFEIVA